jgi:hypothetical protein
LTVDQSFTAPIAPTADLHVETGAPGLAGQYWQATYPTQNFSTDAFLATNPTPTGTFVSTSQNYHGGANVAAHLGADGASLTGGGGNSTDNSTFRVTGFIEVRATDDIDPSQPGIQANFAVGSDDNSRLSIGGFVIAENDGGHGFPHFSTNNTNSLASNAGDNAVGTQTVTFNGEGFYAIDAFWHNGGGGIDMQIFSSLDGPDAGIAPDFALSTLPSDRLFQSAELLPEPASIAAWSVIGVLGLVVGWVRFRRKR